MVKAVIVSGPNEAPEVHDIVVPDVKSHDVRVRIAAAGVCHSDLSMINGTFAPQFPLVLGHEASGTVIEVGDEVTTISVGDRIVVNWAAACRECWFCAEGEPWLCAKLEGVVSPQGGHLTDGTPLHNCLGVGAFAEELVLPERSVVPIPDGIPLDLAALLGCAVLTGVGAVRNTASVRPGESVLVIGQGGIGLSTVLGAKLADAEKIIAVDLSAEKEGLAYAAGATDYLLSDRSLAKQVRALTDGRGVDHAFECVGSPATIRMAWSAVRRGGTCTIVGVGAKDQQVVFSPLELFHFARTLKGSIYGSSDPNRDIPILSQNILDGDLDLNTLVTHRVKIDEVPDAFARMVAGEGARSLIVLDPG